MLQTTLRKIRSGWWRRNREEPIALTVQQTDYGWYLKFQVDKPTTAVMISRFGKEVKRTTLSPYDYLEVVLNVAEWPVTREEMDREIKELIDER